MSDAVKQARELSSKKLSQTLSKISADLRQQRTLTKGSATRNGSLEHGSSQGSQKRVRLNEINFNLKTEYYHLSSPAKVERHAKEILQMVEVTKAINVTYEK